MLYNSSSLVDYLLLSLLIFYTATLVYNPKEKITFPIFLSTFILIIMLILINNYFYSIYSFFFYYILLIIFFKITYKRIINLSLFSTFITVTSIIISKLTLLVFFPSKKFINIKLLIISFIILFLSKSIIKKLIHSKIFNKKLAKLNYLLINIYPVYLLSKHRIEAQSIQAIVVIILLSTLIFLLIIEEQRLEKYKILNKELSKLSSKNEQITTSYRKRHHEYKNKLIIIKSMANSADKELIDYIDYLINEEFEIKDKWLNELKYIPFPSIKNFINYKLNLLESKKAKIEVSIDEEVNYINSSKIDYIDINNINTIIGIMLDNIIEEIEKTTTKQVSINVYISNFSLNILLANTYSSKFDINKISNIGYSTKGKNRGIGLSLVEDIIKSAKSLELQSRIEENFFVQHLIIKNIDKYFK